MKKISLNALLPSMMAAAGCVSVYTFPALNIYLANKEQFAVRTLPVLAVTTVLFSAAVLLAGTVIFLFRKRKYFPEILSFTAALGVCGVIQYHFSSSFFPDYLKEDIELFDLVLMASVNFVLIVLPFAAAWKMRKIIAQNIVKISLVLLLTQLAYGFLPAVTNRNKAAGEYDFVDYSFTEKDKFTFGSSDNVIVLVVDAMGEGIAKEMIGKYPEIKEILKDFTMCDKLTSPVPQTMYAVPAMLSGIPYPVDEDGTPIDALHARFLDQACRSEHSLFQALKKLDFRTEGYSFILQTISYSPDVIDNSIPIPKEIQKSSLLLIFATMLDKFAPVKLHNKPDFLNPQTELANEESEESAGVFDRIFYRALAEKFTVGETGKVFKYLHIHGAHDPVHTDEELRETADASRLDQLRGSFKIVDLLLKKLKQHSLYDNATIVITGDHSETYGPQTICFVKRRNVKREAMAVNSTPHTVSDIAGTILDEYGVASPLAYIKRDEENPEPDVIPESAAIQKYAVFSKWEKQEYPDFIPADEFLQSKATLQDGCLVIESFPDGRGVIRKFRLRIASDDDDAPSVFYADCGIPGNFRYFKSGKLDLPDGVYRVQLETLYRSHTADEHLALVSRRLLNKFLIIQKGVPQLAETSGAASKKRLKTGKKIKFQLRKEYPMMQLPEGGVVKAEYILIPDGSTIMLDLAPGEASFIQIDIANKILDPCYINVSASNGYKVRQQIVDVNKTSVKIPVEKLVLDEQLYVNLGFEVPSKIRKNIGFNLKIKISGISREKKSR